MASTKQRSRESVQQTVDMKEAAALERRHWVRISFKCNNRCAFCLDAGLMMLVDFLPVALAKEQIDAGRQAGATRLILSGGEASIHPDFIELVRHGKQQGYERVQTITNGRMFSYPRFLRQAVDAGLGEITFSLHSHRARIHDTISGVKGAFEQAFAGLRLALAEPRLIVSVDIVINRLNLGALPDSVAHYADLGVGEFDLLHLVPFGRAYSQKKKRVPLAVELRDLQAQLAKTFELGRARNLVIWTNRLPAPVLEGYEHLIQDPHKLVDEVRGRDEHMTLLVEDGEPLPCRDERCGECYLSHFCDQLHPLQTRVSERDLPALRVALTPGATPPDMTPYAKRMERLWIVAPDVDTALRLDASGASEIWELDSFEDLVRPSADQLRALEQRRIERLVVADVDALAQALAADTGEVKLLLNRQTWAWVREHRDRLPPRLVLGVRVPERLSTCLEEMIDLTDPLLGELRQQGVPIEDLPPCLGGHLQAAGEPDLTAPAFVDRTVIDEAGRLDPDRFVKIYIRDAYRTQSLRCASCAHHARCPGLHVNLIRSQSFAVLKPVPADVGES